MGNGTWLQNMKKIEDYHRLKPGTIGVTDLMQGWSLENEIEWCENYVARLEATLHHQYDRLDAMYKQRQWWERFIKYCQTGV
jgi:hypothetical protein